MRSLILDFVYLVMIFSLSCFPSLLVEARAAGQDLIDLSTDRVGKTELENIAIEIDSEASPPLRYEVTLRFSWGAKLNFDERIRDNRDLDDGDDDRDLRTKGSLSVAGLMLSDPRVLKPRFEIFGEVRIQRKVRHKEGKGKTEDETDLEFKKGHVTWRDFIDTRFRIQVGRQRFKDFREWIFDESLDAVRLFYESDGLELQLSYSSNIFDPEDAEDKIKNLIWYGMYNVWKKDKAAVYAVNRRGDDPDNNPTYIDLTFLGVSWKGKSFKGQRYWLEASTVFGDEEGKDVRGYGFDVGWTSRLKYRFKPAVTIGYAFGSGDSNPDDNRDKSFRQTGLQDNSSKLRGVIKVEQYGELFEPELSNLIVGTLAFGIRPLKKASIDLVYHHFQQVWALQERENELRDVGIKPDPNGESRNLGDEIDLVFGWKVTPDLKVEALVAFFLPGSAFPGADNAFLGKIKMRYLL